MRRQSVAELMFYKANTHRPPPPTPQRYFNPSLSTECHGNRSELQQQQPSWSPEEKRVVQPKPRITQLDITSNEDTTAVHQSFLSGPALTWCTCQKRFHIRHIPAAD